MKTDINQVKNHLLVGLGVLGAFLASCLASSTLSFAGPKDDPQASAEICFVPGAGGAEPFAYKVLPQALLERKVIFTPLNLGRLGTVQELSANLITRLEEQLAVKPKLVCHLLGYSLGGIVVRYALTHLSLRHPVYGVIPLKDLVLTVTTVSTPHKGTPIAELVSEYVGEVDPGMSQMGEKEIVIFNDPKSPDYSPQLDGIPYYSYRSFLNAASETDHLVEKVGFNAICADYAKRPGHPSCQSDGVVPTASMSFGKHLADFHVQHSYFATKTRWIPSVIDFYDMHWNFLNGTLKEWIEKNNPLNWGMMKGITNSSSETQNN